MTFFYFDLCLVVLTSLPLASYVRHSMSIRAFSSIAFTITGTEKPAQKKLPAYRCDHHKTSRRAGA
jgi:hypothetical protein